MAGNNVEIRISAVGAEQTAAVIKAVGDAGGRIGTIVAKGASDGGQGLREMETVARSTTGTLTSLGQHAQTAFAVFTGVQLSRIFEQALGSVRDFASGVVQASMTMEQISSTLRVGTGDATSAGKAFDFVRDTARTMGLDLESSAQAFGRLAAASRGTALEGQATRDIFVAMSSAGTVLGLSTADMGRGFTALTQIISKGTVSSEELRGQLGELLPGAMQIAARSMGVTTEKLGEMLQQGQVLASDFLPRFAREIQRAYGGEAVRASEGLRASFNKLSTEFFLLKTQIGDGISGSLAKLLTWASDLVRHLAEGAGETANLQRIWFATWKSAQLAVLPVVDILGDSLIPTLKVAGAAAGAFGVGMSAGFSVIAGPLAYISSVIDDLSNKKWPSHTRATLEANVATAEARQRLAEAVTAFEDLRTSQTLTVESTKKTTEALASTAAAQTQTIAITKEHEKAIDSLRMEFEALFQTKAEQEIVKITAKFKDAPEPVRAWARAIAQAITQVKDLREQEKVLERARTTGLDALRRYSQETDGLTRKYEAQTRVAGVLEQEVQRLNRSYARVEEIRAATNETVKLHREQREAAETAQESQREAARGWSMFEREAALSSKGFADRFGEAWEGFKGGASDAFAAASSFLVDFITGTKSAGEAFVDFGKAILRTITELLAQSAVKQVLKFAGGVVDLVSSGVSGLLGFAKGGIVGQAGEAPGAGDTIPALLELGEMVLPRDLVAKLGEAFGASGSGGGILAGLSNLAFNFQHGGLEAALLGLTPAQHAAALGAGGAAFADLAALGIPASQVGFAAAELGAVGVEATGTAGLLGAGGALAGAAAGAAALGIAANLGLAIFGGNPTGPSAIGTYSGTAAGAAAGALIGTFVFPGVGTVLGGLLGAALGGSLGGFLGGLFGAPSNHALVRAEDSMKNPIVTGHVLDALGMIQTAADKRYTIDLLTGGGPQLAPPAGATVRFDGAQFRRAHTHVVDEALDDAIDEAMRNVLAREYPDGPKTVPFAEGGVVTKPTMALIGEAGPEAVIPLRKMRSGGATYQINVYALDPSSIDARVIDKIVAGIEKKKGRTAMVGSTARG